MKTLGRRSCLVFALFVFLAPNRCTSAQHALSVVPEVVVENEAENEDAIAEVTEERTDVYDEEPFIPTNEWQTVKPGK